MPIDLAIGNALHVAVEVQLRLLEIQLQPDIAKECAPRQRPLRTAQLAAIGGNDPVGMPLPKRATDLFQL